MSLSILQTTGTLEPAPITPSNSTSFSLISGTLRNLFGPDLVVAPSGMYAGTDTRHFWNLTENLYRFLPVSPSEALNFHTVDERITKRAHLTHIQFIYQLIQNTEGWKLEGEQ